MKHKLKLLALLTILITAVSTMNGCVGLPEGIEPVKQFEKNRYLGKWYEIARLDHRFERGLSNITAEYSLREDGGIKVVNRGFNKDKNEWNDVEGRAYFVGDDDVGHLKVSFFGPFYGSYVIFELDKKGYQGVYITSYNRDYLWFLSRNPTVSKAEKDKFIARAKELGFNVDELIFVDHSDQ